VKKNFVSTFAAPAVRFVALSRPVGIASPGRREPVHGGSGRGVHAAHGPAHEPDANRRDALAAHSRVAFA
jgi:hypothetical protein